MAGLSFSNVSKLFAGTPALNGINAEIAESEFVALLGPSGCGKTTLLRLTAGFEVPDSGTITLGGQVLAGSGTFVAPDTDAGRLTPVRAEPAVQDVRRQVQGTRRGRPTA